MNARSAVAIGVAGVLALWVAWGTYVSRTTERVPYETLAEYDGLELRRYPETVLAETTAPDSGTAFRRLFRYITGANEGRETVAMTAPVATSEASTAVPPPVDLSVDGDDTPTMTAPVRSERGPDAVTMAFYLPAEVTLERAPRPTDPTVRLVREPPRTTAVRRFSWYATARRIERERRRLFDRLASVGIEPLGEPVLLQYNDPWTPPFMRTNEIEVRVTGVPKGRGEP